MIDKSNSLDLVAGKFKGTTAEDLAALFTSAAGSDLLVAHFHGGLVSRQSAHTSAEGLLSSVYTPSKAAPVFFVWNSDLWTTLTANLDEIAAEPIFKRLVLRVVQLAVGKLRKTGETRGGKLDLDPLIGIRDKDSLEGIERYARENEPIEPAADELTTEERDHVDKELAADPVLRDESLAIAADLVPPAPGSRGATLAPRKTLMARPVKEDIAAEDQPADARDIATVVTIVRYAAKIVIAVVKRYAGKRDHGLYTTAVEEVLRTLYFDAPAFTIWKAMKKDTADAFGTDPALFGGTSFLNAVKTWWKPGRRVALVGHSTGAIYIAHLLAKANELGLPPDLKFDVVFLAPACTFDFMAEHLAAFQARVANFRMFAMTDENERSYWEIPAVYRGSLLYLVSGLCEDEVDTPILGMQRYHDATGPYAQPNIQKVLAYVNQRCVWSVAAGGAGLASGAKKHGAFDEDEPTRTSLGHILVSGY
jgi:hypothetical protein